MNERCIRDVARVVVQLHSPLTIGSSDGDDLLDLVCVTDASGLPCIPGTSLAGVFRASWTEYFGIEETCRLFGYQRQKREDNGSEEGASCLAFSFGVMHDSQDRPVAPRMTEKDIREDALLRQASSPIVRQHVRITEKGVADAERSGLYDRSMLAAGHRFTFEVEHRGPDATVLNRLLALLAQKSISVGARTRCGLGRLDLVRVGRRQFDCANEKDFSDYCALPCGLHQRAEARLLPAIEVKQLEKAADERWNRGVIATLALQPRNSWMIGGGMPLDADLPAIGEKEGGKEPDMVPYRELRVEWKNGRGRICARNDRDTEPEPVAVIPGTAIKGALRHRTAYHYNRRRQVWAEDHTPELPSTEGNPAVQELFGTIAGGAGAMAGRVVIGDVVPATKPQQLGLMHVSLDRFTCGPLDGHLFSEAPLYQGPVWELIVKILPQRGHSEEKNIRRSLAEALEDLRAGRLQLGAGSGRGHGWMDAERSTLTWSDGGAWAWGEDLEPSSGRLAEEVQS